MKGIKLVAYGPLSKETKDKLDKLMKVSEARLKKLKEEYDSGKK